MVLGAASTQIASRGNKMKIRSRSFNTLLSIAVAIIFTGVAFALGNARDKMKVEFSHPVIVQGDTLPAGQYTIETMAGGIQITTS